MGYLIILCVYFIYLVNKNKPKDEWDEMINHYEQYEPKKKKGGFWDF